MRRISQDVFIIAGNSLVQRANDAAFPFAQDANFWYLTGINEPDWMLIIEGKKSILVAPLSDEVHEVFNGSLSFDHARTVSGVETVMSKAEGEAYLKELSRKHDCVATVTEDPHQGHYGFASNPGPLEALTNVRQQFKEIVDCRADILALRAIKHPEEIEAIRQAVRATTDAFEHVKRTLPQYKYEYHLEAEFTYAFMKRGMHHAYDPIVASGANACTLHYGKNDCELPVNGMVLIDIGAQLRGYCADITRTYAIGTPSKREQAIHAAVEKAHHEIIALIQPGVSLEDYSNQVDTIMKAALKGLGLLEEPGNYRKYFPHAVGHGLGVDVHDSMGGYKEFMPGMVLTVEPGIYVPEEGIGVRIEDDILITELGNENLSTSLPTAL